MAIGSRPIGGDTHTAGAAANGQIPGGGGGGIGGEAILCDADDVAEMVEVGGSIRGFWGNDCCCCTTFSDEFSDNSLASYYTQYAGDWSETSEHLETTDSDAILYLCTDRHAYNWTVSAVVSGSQTGDKIRLNIGGFGPRVIAELEIGTDSGNDATIRLIGPDGTEEDSETVTAEPGIEYRFRVCSTQWGTSIYFPVSLGDEQQICSKLGGIFTNRIGLETSDVTGTVTFDDLVVQEAGANTDCPCGCLIAEDNFDRADSDTVTDSSKPATRTWNELSGDWAISDNKVVTSDSNANLENAKVLSPFTAYRARVDVSGSADGDQVSVGFFQAHVRLTFQSGTDNGTLEVLGGNASCSVTAEPGMTYRLEACGAIGTDGSTFLFMAMLDGAIVLGENNLVGSTKAHLRTGTVNGEVSFDNWELELVCGGCEPVADCIWPLERPLPEMVKVTVADLSDTSEVPWSDLNGEYVLTFRGAELLAWAALGGITPCATYALEGMVPSSVQKQCGLVGGDVVLQIGSAAVRHVCAFQIGNGGGAGDNGRLVFNSFYDSSCSSAPLAGLCGSSLVLGLDPSSSTRYDEDLFTPPNCSDAIPCGSATVTVL